jgi:hypothetical protein
MARQLDNLSEIQDVALALLRKANVDERLPTPVDDLIAASGLLEQDDYILTESKIRQAPRELRRLLRSASRKILGALDRRERVLHVNPAIDVPAQRQFVRCHEAMHDAMPWQRDLVVLGDTGKTLAPSIELRFEREANQGAAELLFQLDFLHRIARDYPTDITTPVELATMFGASIHATFRRWIEQHSGIVSGIVLEPQPVKLSPLAFRRFETPTSEDWMQRFGSPRLPPVLSVLTHPFLADLAQPAQRDINVEWVLADLAGSTTKLRVQSFTNGYRIFVLQWAPGRESFVARRRRRSRIVLGQPVN